MTPLQLQSPQLEFPFTLTNTGQPNVRNCGPLLETRWDHGLLNNANPSPRYTLIDKIRHPALIGFTGPPQFILGEHMPAAYNDHSSITKDIKKRAATSQILRLSTLPAKYRASPLGVAPKQDGTWRRLHHLSSATRHSVNDYIPEAWVTPTYT